MNATKLRKSRLPSIDSKNEDERISAILTPNEPFDAEEDEGADLPQSSLERLTRYQDFLRDKLPVGLKMTGREDLGYFAWEENFIWDDGNDKEHEALKEKFASCDDMFEFIQFGALTEEQGLIVEVKRLADQRIFLIPLVDLDVSNRKMKEHRLVDDYSSWFANFGPEAI